MARCPRSSRFGCTLYPTKPCDVLSCLVEIVGCAFPPAPTKPLRRTQTAAPSVNSPSHHAMITSAVPLPTSATASLQTMLTTSSTTALVCPLPTPHSLFRLKLVHLDGSPALTGHYMVDLLPVNDDSYPLERFVSSGRQLIPLTGYQDLEPRDILGPASSPLLRVSLEALSLHDDLADVSALAESPTPPPPQPVSPPNITSDSPDEPPPELLARLDPSQRESFLRLWNTVPLHIRRIDFALDAAGWDPAALDALSTTLTTYADVFSSSKLDYGECSLRPFEIKVPPRTQPIQSRPYRLKPVLSKQADAILDSYLAAGLIQHSTSPWSSPLVCVPKKSGDIQSTTKS